MEDAVGDAVELQRSDVEGAAQGTVERRGGLHPTALEVQLGIAVHGEHLAAQRFQQARRGQVVAHVGQADPRRNPAMPGAGGEQDGLGHAIGLALLQRVAGLQGLRIAAEHVGVVVHPVAYRVVQRDRLVTRFRRIPPGFFRELHHHGVVTIHEAAGL